MSNDKTKMSGDDPFDDLSPEEQKARQEFISGGASTSTSNSQNTKDAKPATKTKTKPKPKKATMKSHPLLLSEKHIKMIDELSEYTMIAKQKIIRSILTPGLEKMYKEKIEK